MNKVLSIIFCILIAWGGFLSCTGNSYESFLSEKVQTNFSDEMKHLKAIIILPNQGCGGCISEVEDFLIRNYQNYDSVKYVLTKIYSIKILNQKLGDAIINASNVYVDHDNIFGTNSFYKEAQYPAILYLKNGKVNKIEYQHPDNPVAMIQLLKWLSNNIVS